MGNPSNDETDNMISRVDISSSPPVGVAAKLPSEEISCVNTISTPVISPVFRNPTPKLFMIFYLPLL